MRIFLTSLFTVLSVISSFLGYLNFFTDIDGIKELSSILVGEAQTTIVSTETLGEDPEMSMLNVTTFDPVEDSYNQLVCTVRIDGEELATTPVEALPIRPGKHSISLLSKGYIGENVKIEVKSGTSLAFAVRMFPNTANGVTKRNAYLAILEMEALRDVVLVINVSLFVGWLVIAFSIVVYTGFDFDVVKRYGFYTLIPIAGIVFAPMFVTVLYSVMMQNSILTVFFASLSPIIATTVGIINEA